MTASIRRRRRQSAHTTACLRRVSESRDLQIHLARRLGKAFRGVKLVWRNARQGPGATDDLDARIYEHECKMNAALSDIHGAQHVEFVIDQIASQLDGRSPYPRLYSVTLGPSLSRRLTMRKTILLLAGSASLSLLALTGMQGSAQAHEYWYRHHVIRYVHRDGDERYHWYYFHERYHRDHDHR
jgi:hypothetical protein